MPVVQSKRSKASQSPHKPTARPTKASRQKLRKKAKPTSQLQGGSDHEDVNEPSDDSGDVYEGPISAGQDEDEDDDAKSMDSDALDDDDDDDDELMGRSRKRKRASPAKKRSPRTKSPRKKRRDNNDESEDDFELKDGQEVVGTVVQAPKTGRGTRFEIYSSIIA